MNWFLLPKQWYRFLTAKLMTTILTLELLKKVDFDLQQAGQQVKSHLKNGRE
jgi:hypothetical protein